MIHSIYGFDVPTFQTRRNDLSPSSTTNKPSISSMRSIFRNRRANSESGPSPSPASTRPGPEDAGPSRVTSRIPAPIPEHEPQQSPPIDIPGREIQPPNYASQVATTPIPSYEVALSQSPPSICVSLPARSSFSAQSPPPRSAFLEYTMSSRNGTAGLGTPSGSRGCAISDDGDTDEDDPLTPRIIRPTPALNLVPLPQRRATFAAPERPSTPPSTTDSQPLPGHILPLEIPRPPANALPAYSPHLLRDELRLISAVHLDQTHPAAAFFNHIATSFTAPGGAQRQQLRALTTGGKKLKLTLTKGAEKMNNNGTGPIFIRLPRGGEVSGRIEVGKVDHATKLEVAIIGLVNTSYYIRGQYTLIDTLPLCRRMQVLYPPPASEPEEETQEEPTVTISADGIERTESSMPADGAAPTTSAEGSGQNANGTTTDNPTPAILDNEEILSAPEPQAVGKDGLPYLRQGQTFEFNLKMPNHHYREGNIELPPTASIFQVGMQAGVEYVLRIKMSRKGWRLNETITVPIIYEPRAYVSPRRLRALTTDDAMNPGWRTIKLHGGEPTKTTTTTGAEGVDVTLLLPSPPIVFVPFGSEAPPIPFHLHFHSSLPHALSTFSDPKQCQFVIRLMRVATMRIGTEREIRRMEVPAKVEIWQEGGPKIVLSDPRAGNGSSTDSHTPVTRPSSSSVSTGATVSGTSPVTSTGSARRPSSTGGETRRQSFLRRLSLDHRNETREAVLQRQASNIDSSSAAPPVASVAEEPDTAATAVIGTDASTPSAREGSAERTERQTLPSGLDEVDPTAPNGEVSSTESPLAPLSLSSTDVHFLGQLTITYPVIGPELLRRLVQSFMTPEIGITYVLEVGLQPNSGSVKEAFKHVWGGGMVEVVLGARPTEPVDPESQGT